MRVKKGYEKDDGKKAEKLDKEIAKDKESGNDDKLYEEDDRVKQRLYVWALRFQLRSNF